MEMNTLKRIFIVTLIFILTATIFTACKNASSSGDESVVQSSAENYNNDMSIRKLSVSEVKLARLEYSFDVENGFSSTISLTDVRSQFSSFYLRFNKGIYYGVVKTSDGYLFMLFDDNLQFKDGMPIKKLTTKKDFDGIKTGISTVEDIKKVDPGTLLIKNISENALEGESFHRFADGTMLVVTYQKESGRWIVKDMLFKDDPTKFLEYLLPKDLEVLQ